MQLDIKSIQASETVKDQRARIEKLSLVAILNKKQKRILINASRLLKRNDNNFYQNSNLHVTVLGFGPLDKTYYETIQKRIQEFSKRKRSARLAVNFNTIRPGTSYSNNKKPKPLSGPSNGTVTLRISHKLENIFKQYDNMQGNSLKFSISEISLVGSMYKNLRCFTLLHKFKV